jgi:hypothetical protein
MDRVGKMSGRFECLVPFRRHPSMEDGRLTVCLASAEHPNTRPKEFKTAAGDGIILITLERVTGR